MGRMAYGVTGPGRRLPQTIVVYQSGRDRLRGTGSHGDLSANCKVLGLRGPGAVGKNHIAKK